MENTHYSWENLPESSVFKMKFVVSCWMHREALARHAMQNQPFIPYFTAHSLIKMEVLENIERDVVYLTGVVMGSQSIGR